MAFTASTYVHQLGRWRELKGLEHTLAALERRDQRHGIELDLHLGRKEPDAADDVALDDRASTVPGVQLQPSTKRYGFIVKVLHDAHLQRLLICTRDGAIESVRNHVRGGYNPQQILALEDPEPSASLLFDSREVGSLLRSSTPIESESGGTIDGDRACLDSWITGPLNGAESKAVRRLSLRKPATLCACTFSRASDETAEWS